MTQTTSLNQSIGVVLVLSLVGLMLAVTAGAAGTDTVAATVTPELVSVSVTDGTVAYGILAASEIVNTVSPDQTQTATNDGNVTSKLDIKSSDAVGGTTWELAAAVGANAFTHRFSTNDGGAWTAFNADNTTYSALTASVAANGTQTFDLEIRAPSSSSDSTLKTIIVTVLVTAI